MRGPRNGEAKRHFGLYPGQKGSHQESEHKGENSRELEEEDDGLRNHNFIRNMDLKNKFVLAIMS